MPDQLTPEHRSGVSRTTRASWLLPALGRLLLVVTVFAVAGVLAGVLWEWIWTPTDGVVIDHELLLDGDGLRSDFSGTALYVMVAAFTGLLVSVVVCVLSDRYELVTLLGIALGSVLAAWLMLRVGHALGPPDPAPLARAAEDYTRIPDELHVAGTSPYTAFPGGAMVGLIVVFIGLSRRSRHDRD